MRITRGVLLWLEQRIEVPEAAFYIVVGGHLLEAHLSEDLSELRSHLSQRTSYLSACSAVDHLLDSGRRRWQLALLRSPSAVGANARPLLEAPAH